nr:O-antigen polysaccharide polymerase Wzy family protein [Ornithinimicrobium sp. F0845]
MVVVGTVLEAPDVLVVAICIGLLTLAGLTAALASRHYLLGLFVASFAIFLLSRHLIDLVWPGLNSVDSGLVDWTPALETHVLLSLNLALLGLGTGAVFAGHWLRGWISNGPEGRHGRSTHVVSAVRQVGLIMVAVTTPARLLYVGALALFVREEGFYELYEVSEDSVPVPGFVATLGQMNDVAVMAVLATRPSPRLTWTVLGLYLLDGVASLATLERATFFLNILLVVVYLAYRQATRTPDEPQWLRPWAVLAGVATVPLMAMVSQKVVAQRGRNQGVERGGPVLEFLHAQGVSVNVIAFTQQFADEIPEGRWYSLGPLIEFVRYRLLGVFTGETQLTGNNAERALEGHIFSHTVSYLAIPDVYARGSGYGSSFVAELYVDLGYPGVFLGSIVIGALTAVFTAMLGWGMVPRLLALLMIRQLFFIPRSSFTGFFVNAFDLYNMVALAALAVGAWLFVSYRARDGDPTSGARDVGADRPRTSASLTRVRR